jgi:DNA-binding transcriptional MerR regulator
MKGKLRVSDVAAKYNISKRTIKYYEEIGILKSFREEGSNYRIYDDYSLDRLEKILILRRLDFSINDICQILNSDNRHTKKIFQDKLETIMDEISALTSLQNIVKSFLNMSSNVGIDNVNIYQILSEQVYIHKKIERVIDMSKYEGDIIRIEIGKSIIPHANLIINEIKSLRVNLKENLKVDIPLIRLTDNELIGDSEYRVLFKNNVVIDKKFDEKSIQYDITSLISELEEVITNNVNELIE